MTDEIVFHEWSMETEEPIGGLSDTQEKILALLPIPTALLSIFGSVTIIIMAFRSRSRRHWTPYTRLLLGMSVSDIYFSFHISISTFLRPRETSPRVWAFGNDTSCSIDGFLGQLAYSAILYNGMLSYYFLFAARFGLNNKTISKYIEPSMHVLSIGFPLVTASVGLVMGVYAEPTMGMGCWVNDYPRNCGDGLDDTGEECLSGEIGWIFGGLPFLFVGASLVINNLMIWAFVRKHTAHASQTQPQHPKKALKPTLSRCSSSKSVQEILKANSNVTTTGSNRDDYSMISEPDKTIFGSYHGETTSAGKRSQVESDEEDGRENRYDDDTEEHEVSSSHSTNHRHHQQLRKDQIQRLQLVKEQALLFVGSYFLCNGWSGILSLFENGADSNEEEIALSVQIYWVSVLHHLLLPLQGFLNMLVYIRPKYMKHRKEFPEQSKFWAFQRVMHGENLLPAKEGAPSALLIQHPANHNNCTGDGEMNQMKNINIIQKKTVPLTPKKTKTSSNRKLGSNAAATLPQDVIRPTMPHMDTTTAPLDDSGGFSRPASSRLPGREFVSSLTASRDDFEEVVNDLVAGPRLDNNGNHEPNTNTTDMASWKPLKNKKDNMLISDLTASQGDFDQAGDDDEEVPVKEDQRWESPQDLSTWTPIQKTRRPHSSFRSLIGSRASSLEVISELSALSFHETLDLSDDDESSPHEQDETQKKRRWSSESSPSLKKPPTFSLPMPKRIESEVDLEEEFDRMNGISSDTVTDSPILLPSRKSSQGPIIPKRINSAGNLFSLEDEPFDRMDASTASDNSCSGDTPICLPTRRLSPTAV